MNYELSNAFIKDIQSAQINNEISNIDDESIKDINNKEELDKEDKLMPKASEEVKEISIMTDNDLYTKVRRAINATDNNKYYYLSRLYPYSFKAIAYEWDAESEDDHVSFMYTVNSDETISITSQEDVKMVFIPKETMDSSVAEMQTKLNEAEEKVATLEADISTKIEALVKASEEVTALTNEVSTLMPFKEEADKLVEAENQRLLSEKKESLKKYALKSGHI
jgi:hypothetical protein